MERPVRYLSLCGLLGYGYPREGLDCAVASGIDFLSVDAGSTDPGPYYLGAGVNFVRRSQVRSDLAPAVSTLSPESIARLYYVREADVAIRPFAQVLTIKVTLPRPSGGSGGPKDTDVYGCRQHFPLGEIEV